MHLRIVCEARAQLAEDSGDVCVGWLRQAVVSPFAIAARGDESGAAQIRKVSRNLRLVRSENFNARTDAELIVTQEVNEPQAGVVGQCFEDQFQVHLPEITMFAVRRFILREIEFEAARRGRKSLLTRTIDAEYFTS